MSITETSDAAPRARELNLETDYLRLSARAWGEETATPVLALHGWLDNAASFDALAPLLPDIYLVALDLPGHGLSEHRPPGVYYHFVDYVADALAAADALSWKSFSLLGHSMGAGIASFVAAVAPERVRKLVLIEGLGPLSMSPKRGPEAHAESIQQMRRLQHKRAATYASLEEAAQARLRAGDLKMRSALTLVRRSARFDQGRLIWRSDSRLKLRSPHYYSERQVLEYLQRIKAPTRLLYADHGLLAGRNMKRRYACVENLEKMEIPGGHHVHMDAPLSVAPLVAEHFA